MFLRHLKVFGIAAVFAAIAYGLMTLIFRLTRDWL
jgi:hypothetical protein